MTDTLPTKDELLDPTDDYAKLRRAAMETLENSGLWQTPLEVIAEALLRTIGKSALCKAVFSLSGVPDANDPDEEARAICDAWGWYVFATPAERIVYCLVALAKVRLTPCHPPSAPGPLHEAHHPGDDTCSRNWKSLNDLVNKVLTAP